MIINRADYIAKLSAKSWNGKVKIITGIRRCGKSFLLSVLFKQHLIETGVTEDSFIEIDLEKRRDVKYRNPNVLYDYVVKKSSDMGKRYYVFIDEIHLSYRVKSTDIDEKSVPEEDRELLYTTFYDVLNDLMGHPNLDVYVTGSNSKMLSTDIVTNFRDRGSEIRVYPLSFKEFCQTKDLDKIDALEEYLAYGGMPLAVLEDDEAEKRKYLINLYKNVYLKDIIERNKLKDITLLDTLTDVLSSSVGSLTNPHKLANTACSILGKTTSDSTIKKYINILEDAYLFSCSKRWNVKGRKYFGSIQKYYAVDLGLRNARLNWRQQERSHLMENILYNELLMRGLSVDVGVVEVLQTIDGKRKQSQYEIDFVVNTGKEKVYIQSAMNVDDPEKRKQETFSLKHSGDFYRKIVVLDGNQRMWTDEDGIIYVGIIPFLLDVETFKTLI